MRVAVIFPNKVIAGRTGWGVPLKGGGKAATWGKGGTGTRGKRDDTTLTCAFIAAGMGPDEFYSVDGVDGKCRLMSPERGRLET